MGDEGTGGSALGVGEGTREGGMMDWSSLSSCGRRKFGLECWWDVQAVGI